MSSESSNTTASHTVRNRIIVAVVAVIAVAVIAIGIAAFKNHSSAQRHATPQSNNQPADVSPLPSKLQRAVKKCDPHTDFDSSDNTKESLIADGAGKSLTLLSGSQSDFTTFDCVAKQLDMPADDITAMTSKQDQPDQQTFTWDGLTASWIYNANSGLSLTITAAE
ncbi:hypothetical protein [Bifidobacterium saguinibicoloris]|uniref:hypothetical protein n=1 Tax=Bifidobacterium saguinibicoloris TaxID=2834433 RepID=UPI001C58555A|nr:hypothetical protein [Bifidobacterium saguinibicoloris]MBW3081338.1 hypothetical protein [Bifidobacterium saguinibicoloris]